MYINVKMKKRKGEKRKINKKMKNKTKTTKMFFKNRKP
jgi:hypothetical protein